MKSLRFLMLGCAAMSLLACATTPRSIPMAEKLLANDDYDGAERFYRSATEKYLTESERERVRDGLRRVAEKRAEPQLRSAQATPGFAGLVALAEARKSLRRNGAGLDEEGRPTSADERLEAAIVARIESLWPTVTTEAAAHRYGGAIGEAERLLAPLGDARPQAFVSQYAAVLAQGQAFHRARLAASKRADGGAAPGAQALHAGLVRRFGGEAESPIDSLRAAARVRVSVSSGTSGACAEVARSVANTGTLGGRPATVRVLLSRCHADSQVQNSSVNYTWVEKVPYQVTERVQTGTRQVIDQRKRCSHKSVMYKNGRQVPAIAHYDCSTYKSEPVYSNRVVTKYKDVNRQGVRHVRTERNQLHYEGVAEVSWGEGRLNVPLAIQLNATDSAQSDHAGSTKIAFAKSLPGLHQAAVAKLQSTLVTSAIQAVNADAARRAEAEAAAAIAKGDVAAAEDADVRAILALDAVSAATVARIGARYGLDGPGLKAALDGKAPVPSTANLALDANDVFKLGERATTAGQYSGDAILERGFNIGRLEYGLRGFTSHDLPGQPDRAGVAFLMRLAYPAIGQMFDGDTFEANGWVLFDTLMFDFSLGARTGDAVQYENDKEEGGVAVGGGLGYQMLPGYRGSKLGVFAGVRAQRFARMAGDFRTGGASYPLVGRLELKVFDRNPIFIEAYGLKVLGENEVRGLDVLLTLSGIHGLSLRYERTHMDARYNGKRESDVIDLGRQVSSTFDLSYAYQF